MALTDNILAYWKLDANGSALSLADSTGNGNTLTNSGGVGLGTGKIGGGASFGGGAQYLQSSFAGNLGSNFSISFWFNGTDATAGLNQLGQWTDSWVIGSNSSNGLYFISSGNGVFNFPISNAFDGSWHFYTVISNNGSGSLYVDGATDLIIHSFGTLTSSTPLTIGATEGYENSTFGQVDEVGIWSRALSAAEVTELYNSAAGNSYPFGGGGTPPVAPHKNIVPRSNGQGKIGTPTLRWDEGHFQTALTLGGSPVATAASIPAQVNSDWNSSSGASQILNKPSLATVATSGSASDLSTGTLPLARLDSLVSRDDQNNSFTAGQSITAPANTSALTASYSVTGANTTPLVSLTGTWNTTGVARGLLLNITDPASAATSLLADLSVGSRTQYAFTKSRQFWLFNSSPATQDASNFERGFMRWNANALEIGTEAGGTGTARVVRIAPNSVANGITFTANSAAVDISTVRSIAFGSGLTIGPSTTIGGWTATNYATGAAGPTTTSLTNGNWQVHRNTTSGTIRLWANNNGTLVSVALA